MATTKNVTGLCTNVRIFQFGGQSGKKAKRLTVQFTDATNGIEVGGTTNMLTASDLGFTVIESCSNLTIFTTSTLAVARVIPAAASPDGSYIALADETNATDANRANAADVVIATTETGQITVEGY